MTQTLMSGDNIDPAPPGELDSPEFADLEIQPLSSTQWRVRDRRRRDDDGFCILGFIEKTPNHRYEAMEINHGQRHTLAWSSFTCLADAVAHFIKTSTRSSPQVRRRLPTPTQPSTEASSAVPEVDSQQNDSLATSG